MTNGITAEQVNARLRELEAKRARIESEEADLQVVLRVIHNIGCDQPASPVAVPKWEIYPDVAIDFSGATNLLQRVLRVFKAVGGSLDIMDVARCLIERGLYNGKAKNIRGNISNELKDNPEFIRVGVGLFEYRPAGSEQDASDANVAKLTVEICDSEYNTK